MPASVTVAALFRQNRSFTKLYFARLVSLLGDWFNMLAIIALLRDLGEGGAGGIGWLLIFKTLPSLVMTPFAGAAADRYSRRSLMMATDLARALVVLAMFVTLIWPSTTLVYLLVILQSSLSAFFEPARQALLPDIVSPEELTTANAIGAATWSAMLTVGAALGGLFTARFGWQLALVVDALSYLVSMLFLLGLAEPPRPARRAAADAGLAASLGLVDARAGLRYALGRPRILSLMLVKAGWCVAGGITLVLTVLGERVYPLGGKPMLGVALLYSARGLGTAIGPFLGRWWSGNEPAAMERLILPGFLCGAAFYALLSLVESPELAALVVVIAHFGGSLNWVFSTIRLQQLVPSEVRGRVFALEQGLFTTVLSVSTWAYGWLIDHEAFALETAPLLLGLSLTVPSACWLLRGLSLGWGGEAAELEARLEDERAPPVADPQG
jgi:predicted MFS family arabinose efflux permease